MRILAEDVYEVDENIFVLAHGLMFSVACFTVDVCRVVFSNHPFVVRFRDRDILPRTTQLVELVS